MATRDLHSNVKVVQSLKAAAVTTTQTSTAIDGKGFESIEHLIIIGEMTNVGGSPVESWAFKLQHSDDNSTFADVTDTNHVLTGSASSPVTAPDSSSGIFLVVNAASEDDSTYRVGYSGPRRYSRVVGVPANTPGSTPLAIVGVLGNAGLSPTQDA